MDQETQHGYLVLADVTGYTSYLAGVELTHAQSILSDLLELLVEQLQPLLSVAELEGDAVFAHAPQSAILRDETLLELVEATYLAFRDRVESIRRRTTCQCNACRAIPSLDLKFIIHFGEYLVQSVSGAKQLVGSDVNLVHRLLKNQVQQATGWRAYILLTEPALDRLHLQLDGLHELVEHYEHLGDVKTYSLDLHARHEALRNARRVFLSVEESDIIMKRTLAAAPVVVWEWMNEPQKRLQWEHDHVVRPLLRPGGRTGAGAQNHCAHGTDVVVETLLDWQPFTAYTTENPMIIWSYALAPVPAGTELEVHAKLKLPLPRLLRRLVGTIMIKKFDIESSLDDLVRMMADEKRLQPAQATAETPALDGP